MKAKDPGGLCSTCINAAFCVNLRERGGGAVQCELFDQGASPIVDLDRVPSLAAMYATPQDPCQGLCATCDLVEKCMSARPQGGVWHCEEYC